MAFPTGFPFSGDKLIGDRRISLFENVSSGDGAFHGVWRVEDHRLVSPFRLFAERTPRADHAERIFPAIGELPLNVVLDADAIAQHVVVPELQWRDFSLTLS